MCRSCIQYNSILSIKQKNTNYLLLIKYISTIIYHNYNYDKILNSDWLSAALI